MDLSETLAPIADVAPPSISAAAAEAFVSRNYGVNGKFTTLPSERDQLFQIRPRAGDQYLLRISGASERLDSLRFQNEAIRHIHSTDPELPIPIICKSVRDADTELMTIEGVVHGVRLFTYLPGDPVRDQRPTSALREDIGRSLARLDRALENFPSRLTSQDLLWDIRKLPLLQRLAAHIDGSSAKAQVDHVFSNFTDKALPKLGRLPDQVIHNDFNRKNLLVDSSAPNSISGIIDFGDMMFAPRVVDLSVAVARNIDVESASVSACEIVKGYNSVVKLSGDEIAILFWLICGRLVLRSVIWSWRKGNGDSRYDTAGVPVTLKLLDGLQSIGEDRFTEMFRSVCVA